MFHDMAFKILGWISNDVALCNKHVTMIERESQFVCDFLDTLANFRTSPVALSIEDTSLIETSQQLGIKDTDTLARLLRENIFTDAHEHFTAYNDKRKLLKAEFKRFEDQGINTTDPLKPGVTFTDIKHYWAEMIHHAGSLMNTLRQDPKTRYFAVQMQKKYDGLLAEAKKNFDINPPQIAAAR